MRNKKGPLFESIPVVEGVPLYRQVYRRIREAILAGELRAGERLPSTRTLAGDVSLARKTVEDAYAQLEAEGYVVRRSGSGSYVAEVARTRMQSGAVRLIGRRTLGKRGRGIASTTACVEPTIVRPFAAGTPALDAFPIDVWQRLVARHARRLTPHVLGYGDPAGLPALREAIATYLWPTLAGCVAMHRRS